MDMKTRRDVADYQYALGLTYLSNHDAHPQQPVQLQSAIVCFQQALELYAIDDTPSEWARTQQILGQSYRDLATNMNDIEKRTALLRQSVSALQASLEVYTRGEYPIEWAKTQCELAATYLQFPGNTQETSLPKAIRCLQAALNVYSLNVYPLDWARTQQHLGNAYILLLSEERIEALLSALSCYESSFYVYQVESYPSEWAMLQYNLGNLYVLLGSAIGDNQSWQSYYHFKQALQVYNEHTYPLQWASTMTACGDLLMHMPNGNVDLLKDARKYYENALRVYTRDAYPLDWINAQTCLGMLHYLISGLEGQEQALSILYTVFEVCTRETYPENWADTHCLIGQLYLDLASKDDSDDLAAFFAIDSFTDALLVYSQVQDPYSWAKIQYNIGQAYYQWKTFDEQEHIQKAIDYFEAALQVYSRQTTPLPWAEAHLSLGNAYQNLHIGDHQKNLNKAIACYRAALLVYSKDGYDYTKATIHQQLANAYLNIAFLETHHRHSNLRSALECNEIAMEFFSKHPQQPGDLQKMQADIDEIKEILQLYGEITFLNENR
jgi:tetratricopeptide (TPR) repeat protein